MIKFKQLNDGSGTKYAIDGDGVVRSLVTEGEQLLNIVTCGDVACTETQGDIGDSQELIEAVILSPVDMFQSPDTGSEYPGPTLHRDYPLLGRYEDSTLHPTNDVEIVGPILVTARMTQVVFDDLLLDDRYQVTSSKTILIEIVEEDIDGANTKKTNETIIDEHDTPSASQFGQLNAWWRRQTDPKTGQRFSNDYLQSMIGDYKPGRPFSEINHQMVGVIKGR